jgi:signal transduction histidine kinase
VRLSLSIALWLTVAVLIILGGHGWIQLREEEGDLDAAARQELTLVATATRSAVENAIRDNQEADVTALLEQVEVKDPAVDVFVLGEGGRLLGSSVGAEGNLTKVRNLVRDMDLQTLRVEELSTGELAAVAPLRIRDSMGQLVVVLPLIGLRADLADERRAVAVSVGLLIAALVMMIWVVVRLRVHLPLRQIIAGVRQIRSGDLSARIGLVGTYEFAELAREFDAMTGSLEQAQHDLATAAEAREKLELEMQRANRMAIVGEFAATLAHEIGSPLQVLNGRARDLATREDLPADATRSAAILVEQTDRVHHIVERLLDVARRKAPELVDFDIRESVQRVVELVSAHARRLGVQLDVDFQDVPRLRGDRAQVQQVLLNLIQNALRATSEGGGVVRITIYRSSFARASESRPRRSVAIMVDDTGSGIPQDILDRVFEPFFTAWDGERTSRGSGLGLAVVKSIVTDHGGIVRAEALPQGSGARFVVHFPVQVEYPA